MPIIFEQTKTEQKSFKSLLKLRLKALATSTKFVSSTIKVRDRATNPTIYEQTPLGKN